MTLAPHSIKDLCTRVQQWLEQATFDQKLLIDPIIVTGEEVEIR